MRSACQTILPPICPPGLARPALLSTPLSSRPLCCAGLIVGAPTWHTDADTERSGTTWDDWLYSTLPDLDLSGKKVAVFGVGDQQSYNDYYCDAAGELYDLFEAKGCTMVGMTSTDGYDHSASKAEKDGKFVGLMCDEDNQYDMSEDRAKAWVEQLKSEGFPF